MACLNFLILFAAVFLHPLPNCCRTARLMKQRAYIYILHYLSHIRFHRSSMLHTLMDYFGPEAGGEQLGWLQCRKKEEWSLLFHNQLYVVTFSIQYVDWPWGLVFCALRALRTFAEGPIFRVLCSCHVLKAGNPVLMAFRDRFYHPRHILFPFDTFAESIESFKTIRRVPKKRAHSFRIRVFSNLFPYFFKTLLSTVCLKEFRVIAEFMLIV